VDKLPCNKIYGLCANLIRLYGLKVLAAYDDVLKAYLDTLSRYEALHRRKLQCKRFCGQCQRRKTVPCLLSVSSTLRPMLHFRCTTKLVSCFPVSFLVLTLLVNIYNTFCIDRTRAEATVWVIALKVKTITYIVPQTAAAAALCITDRVGVLSPEHTGL